MRKREREREAWWASRNEEMASRYLAGATLAEVGAAMGVTRQRVHQVLVELGVKRRSRGRTKVRAERVCDACGVALSLPPWRLAARRSYCGVTCRIEGQRRPEVQAERVEAWLRSVGRLSETDPSLR